MPHAEVAPGVAPKDIPKGREMSFWIGNKKAQKWRLEGWDAFAGHSYPLPGAYSSEQKALRAARAQLSKIERQQPGESSGGQDGIQDQVYIISPNGKRTRVYPE